jgi:hypothetical protein
MAPRHRVPKHEVIAPTGGIFLPVVILRRDVAQQSCRSPCLVRLYACGLTLQRRFISKCQRSSFPMAVR